MEPAEHRLKLPHLRWKGRVAWFDHGGSPRRWTRLGTDEADVRRLHAKLMSERAPAAPGTVDAMLADYLSHPRAPLAPGTAANYRAYRKHLAAPFGPLEPSTVTQADIIRYMRNRTGKTARAEVGLLSMAFVNWIEQGRLSFNPCFGVRIKGLPTSKRGRLLSDVEIDAIVAQAGERLAVAVELAYSTGLRIGDLCRLRWADVADGLQTAKTGARQAWTMTEGLRGLLDRARALQGRVASLYVLCDRQGRPWKPDTLRDGWNRACKRAGVADAHFHDLRAAGATALDASGGDAQRFLGHRQRQTTEVYLRDRRTNVVRPLERKRSTR